VLHRRGAIPQQMLRNLFLESNLGREDWRVLVDRLLSVDPDPPALESQIRDFCRERLLIGPQAVINEDTRYGWVREAESFLMFLVILGQSSDIDEAHFNLTLIVDRSVDDLSEAHRRLPLGHYVMWSTFDPDGKRPFDFCASSIYPLLSSLGLGWGIHRNEFLLFEYKLDEAWS